YICGIILPSAVALLYEHGARMVSMRVPQKITLTKREKSALEGWSKGRKVSVRQAERAKIVLLAAASGPNKETAAEMEIKPHTVGRWRSRLAELRLGGIEKDLPRGGRPPQQR